MCKQNKKIHYTKLTNQILKTRSPKVLPKDIFPNGLNYASYYADYHQHVLFLFISNTFIPNNVKLYSIRLYDHVIFSQVICRVMFGINRNHMFFLDWSIAKIRSFYITQGDVTLAFRRSIPPTPRLFVRKLQQQWNHRPALLCVRNPLVTGVLPV